MKIAIKNKYLKNISEFSRKSSVSSYLVGGSVRDLIQKKKSRDIDIVVEGDTAKLAHGLSKYWNGKLVSHKRFGTFTILLKNGAYIDFATARKETYARPGALPVVTFSTIDEDLFRRDFTINAMAVYLEPSLIGTVLDKYNGIRDLRKRELNVLHKRSFKDDPTRILRLARFTGRGFKPGKTTKKHLKENIRYLSNISYERIKEELIDILNEKDPYCALNLLDTWGVFKRVLPEIHINRKHKKLKTIKGFAKRLNHLLTDMGPAAKRKVLSKMGFSRKIKKEIDNLNKSRAKTSLITGKDLIDLNYTPGPVFSKIINLVKKRNFKSRQNAIRFVIDNFPQKR
jgi:tRNA nucleotidyltransferase/poly(A) polymerase